jgi:hypothetical protein
MYSHWVKINGVETLVSKVRPKLGIMGLESYTLTLGGRDFQVNTKGIVQNEGPFCGKSWVLVNRYLNALKNFFYAAVYDTHGHLVHVIELQEWEADIVHTCDYLVVGLYLSSEGLNWYFTEVGDEEDLTNYIKGVYSHQEKYDVRCSEGR